MNARHFFKVSTMPMSTRCEFIRQLQAMATLANELKTDYNATLAKIDADAGTGMDTDYAATNPTSAASVSLT
jgi:hypothetical protein